MAKEPRINSLIRVPPETLDLARRLAHALAFEGNGEVTIGETVARALGLLEADVRRRKLPIPPETQETKGRR